MPTTIPDTIQSFEIHAGDAAVRRPVLAIEAARLFALWAGVEYSLGAMASVLIGDSGALTLLDKLRSRNQKLDGIEAVAAEKVEDTETRDLLRPVFKLINRAAGPRNQLAHCLWGTIEQLPDALLLTNPDAALKASRLITGAEGQRVASTPGENDAVFEHNANMSNEDALKVVDLLRRGTEVWRQADFIGPQTLLNSAIVALTQYTVAISALPSSDAAIKARAQLRDVLRDCEPHY